MTLVDTNGQGVDEITEDSVIVDGKAYKIDCLVYATGFEVGTDYTRRAGYDPVGRGGVHLKDYWADGMRSLHGLAVHGFPNMFLMGPGQAGFTANYPHSLAEQAEQIGYILSETKARQAGTFEASAAAEEEWVQTIIAKAIMRQQFLEECTPGYYNNEGKPSDRAAQNNPYGEGPNAYFRILKAWREDGGMPGLELS